MKQTKRQKRVAQEIIANKIYPASEAFEALKKLSSNTKFIESVDITIRLGIDARKSDQMVRGASVLPNGTGKSVRVAVFAQGDNVEKARLAGADIIGNEDLAEKIKGGMLDFDVVIATPDTMRAVGQLGQILGPRNLMPNPKVGTVTPDVTTAVKNAKSGQIRYKNDKNGIIHSTVGKVNFDVEMLKQNAVFLLNDIKKLKPTSSKGQYIRKVVLSTTMGPGIIVDISSLTE